MPTVLIVSPHFPPTNTPDMHRVRLSLAHYAAYGWRPAVLAIDPTHTEGVHEPLLLKTIPSDIPVQRVQALPRAATQRLGVGNAALRAWPYLYQAGTRMINSHCPDLVFFSTTQFPTMALGRLWKAKYGVPYVLDMQDPWVYHQRSGARQTHRGLKHRLMWYLHQCLEPWTMRRVGGIIAVTDAYHETLRQRYPWIAASSCRTIPFGAAQADFDVAAQYAAQPTIFARDDGLIHGVYAGALGPAMRHTCRAICAALQQGLQQAPALFSRVRLHFVGTDYAADSRAVKTIEPIATRMQLGDYVREYPHRLPYLSTLNLLRQANFLLVPGSSYGHYTASKIYPYILAQKPLVALFHEESSVVEVLRRTRSGDVVTFASSHDIDRIAHAFLRVWSKMIQRSPAKPHTDWQAFSPYTASELTRLQCRLFDRVLNGDRPHNLQREWAHAHDPNAA